MTARGVNTVRERIASIPGVLRAQTACPLPALSETMVRQGVVATGVGSSEAAARFWVAMLQDRGVPARFLPLSAFYAENGLGGFSSHTLFLFTQGLSPNAELVLRRRKLFGNMVLVTASTIEGQRAAGKADRAEWLERLEKEGAGRVNHPLENEYEILPRFVGPVCAMLEVLRMVESVFPGSGPDLNPVPALFDPGPQDDGEKLLQELNAGVSFYFTNATSPYAGNLSCKILESLFLPAPEIMDGLTYAHGPFQLDCTRPHAKWIFTSQDADETDLVNRLLPMFERTGPVRVFPSPLPPPLAVFAYEALLNQVVLAGLEKAEVDLIDWPGKGEDGEGYGIRYPGPNLEDTAE